MVIIYWEDDFGWSVSSLSQLMAVTHVCNGLSTPLSGYLIDHHPAHLCIAGGLVFLGGALALTGLMTAAWQVWLVAGVLCGTAYGLLNLNVFSVAVMQHLSPDQHGLAVGVATSGSTFGQFALVPLFVLVTRRWGWRAGYLSLAALACALAPLAFFLLRGEAESQVVGQGAVSEDEDEDEDRGERRRRHESETGLPDDLDGGQAVQMTTVCAPAAHLVTDLPSVLAASEHPEKQLEEASGSTPSPPAMTMRGHLVDMWRCPQFLALTVAFFLCGVTTTGFVETHLVKLAVHNGFSLLTGSLAFSVLAACNGASIVCSGFLADRLNRHYLLASIFTLRACAYLLLLSPSLGAGGLAALFVFAVLFGVADYSVVPPVVSLVKTHLPCAVGLSTGVLLMFHSAGAALGAALGGVLFQRFGGYDEAVGLCAGLSTLGAIACAAMQRCGLGGREKMFRGVAYSDVNTAD